MKAKIKPLLKTLKSDETDDYGDDDIDDEKEGGRVLSVMQLCKNVNRIGKLN